MVSGAARIDEAARGAQQHQVLEAEARLTVRVALRREEAVAHEGAHLGDGETHHLGDLAGAHRHRAECTPGGHSR